MSTSRLSVFRENKSRQIFDFHPPAIISTRTFFKNWPISEILKTSKVSFSWFGKSIQVKRLIVGLNWGSMNKTANIIVIIIAIILFCILVRYYIKHAPNVPIWLCFLFWKRILSDFSTGRGKNDFIFFINCKYISNNGSYYGWHFHRNLACDF